MTMDDTEVGMLLARLTAIDPHRDVGMTVTATWADLFADVDVTYEQAYAALLRCAKTTPAGFIGPNEIIKAIGVTPQRQLELDRMEHAGPPPFPGNLTQGQEREWRTLWLTAIKAGAGVELASEVASKQMDLPPERLALGAGDPRIDEAIADLAEILGDHERQEVDHLTLTPCTKDEAIEAAGKAAKRVKSNDTEAEYRFIVRSRLGRGRRRIGFGRARARWRLEHLIAELHQAKTFGWCDGIDGYDLVVFKDGHRLTFEVPRPKAGAAT